MNKYLFIVFACFASSCSVKTEKYKLLGKMYCPPTNHIIAKIPWVKADNISVRDSNGFALVNCVKASASDSKVKEKCLFSREIESVVIDEDQGFRIQPNRPDFKDSLVGRVFLESNSTRELFENGSIIVVENSAIWRSWFVWKLHDNYTNPELIKVKNLNELLMTCSGTVGVARSTSGDIQKNVECERSYNINGLSITYKFASNIKIPSTEFVQNFDEQVLNKIRSFRCK